MQPITPHSQNDPSAQFTFDLVLDLSQTGNLSDIVEYLGNLIGCLYDAQQIVSEDGTFVQAANALRVSVTCPEEDALAVKNCTDYGKHWMKKIENTLKTPMQFIPTGRDPRYEAYAGQEEEPPFYVLYGNRHFPLFDGGANRFVPLYKIPFTYHDEACYNDVQFWNNNYGRLYGLWFSGELEKFAQRQMQDPHSALSVQGRVVRQRIEAVTGVPTYYFLFNYRQRSLSQDRARKCPLCGKDWLIEGAEPSDTLAFRCEDDRLVSEFTRNSTRKPNRWTVSAPFEIEHPLQKLPKRPRDLPSDLSSTEPAEAAPEPSLKQQMIEIYQDILLKLPSDPLNFNLYYHLSFCALFAADYTRAIEAARQSLHLNPRMIEVEANLALAYLLNDQYGEAEEIYQKWKGKKFKSVDRDTADKIFLSDIAELESAGIRHPDFERVRRFFRK